MKMQVRCCHYEEHFWVLKFVLSDPLNVIINNINNNSHSYYFLFSIRVQMDPSCGTLHLQYKHFLRYIFLINKTKNGT